MVVTLNIEDYIEGIFSLIFVIISIIVGLVILSKYFKHKNRLLIYVGLSWIGIVSPWYPSAINFLYVLLTNQSLSDPVYFAIGNIPPPIVLFIWFIAFTEFINKGIQKQLLLIYGTIAVIYEIFLIFFLFNDLSYVGYKSDIFASEHTSFVMIFLIAVVFVVLITGLLFARESLRSDNPEIRLKGKFLAVAFISWTVGSIIDSGFDLGAGVLIIIRILLISSAIEFYLGFIMPERIKNLLLKQ